MADITIGLVEDCKHCNLRNKTNLDVQHRRLTKSNNTLFDMGAKLVMLTQMA